MAYPTGDAGKMKTPPGHCLVAFQKGIVFDYQLDLVTPGIMPEEASSRKVMREILKRRM